MKRKLNIFIGVFILSVLMYFMTNNIMMQNKSISQELLLNKNEFFFMLMIFFSYFDCAYIKVKNKKNIIKEIISLNILFVLCNILLNITINVSLKPLMVIGVTTLMSISGAFIGVLLQNLENSIFKKPRLR